VKKAKPPTIVLPPGAEHIQESEAKLDAIKHFLNTVRDRDYIRVERSWVITRLEKVLDGTYFEDFPSCSEKETKNGT
jgi:hypothetical protein